jgi:small subunit ribosomal protein S14
MAKVSAIDKDLKRRQQVKRFASKRAEFKSVIKNKDKPIEERMDATFKLSKLPRNGSKIRVRNRCKITGRPRAFYRKFEMSRIALRELGSNGLIPGLTKSSW